MKLRLVALAIAIVLVAVLALDLAGQAPDPREQAIVATALDYSDGAYSGDAVRMERAIHPDLNKLIFMRRSPAMGLSSNYSTFSGLVEMTRMAVLNLEPDKRKTEVTVLESSDDVACVRLKSSQWCDYLQMVKAGGGWKIVNVLWTSGLDAPPARKVVPASTRRRSVRRPKPRPSIFSKACSRPTPRGWRRRSIPRRAWPYS